MCTAEAADKVKGSAGRVPCIFRFMKTELLEDGTFAPNPTPAADPAASTAAKKPGLMARCLPKLFGSRAAKKEAAAAAASKDAPSP